MTILISFLWIGFYKLSFRFFYFNPIPRIPARYCRHSHPDFPHSHPDSRIPTPISFIPTPFPAFLPRFPHIPTPIPHIPTHIPLIPFPDSPFRLLQIAFLSCFLYFT